jgi:hypothetical protein
MGRGYSVIGGSIRLVSLRRANRRPKSPANAVLIERLEPRVLLSSAPVSTTWTDVATPVPASDGAQIGILLSNGMVMYHGSSGTDGTSADWYGLTPNSSGSYVNGTWSTLASMSVSRLYFGSNVLPNGNFFLVGGEYASDQSDSGSAEVYNPVTNVWTDAPNFPGENFGDDPSEVLSNGTVLTGAERPTARRPIFTIRRPTNGRAVPISSITTPVMKNAGSNCPTEAFSPTTFMPARTTGWGKPRGIFHLKTSGWMPARGLCRF